MNKELCLLAGCWQGVSLTGLSEQAAAWHQLTLGRMGWILASPEQEVSGQTRERQMRIQPAVFTATILALLAPAVFAQPEPTQAVIGVAGQRIVDECQSSNGVTSCSLIQSGDQRLEIALEQKRTTLAIPGYREGDEARYFYYVARLRDRGSGGGTPDYVENGIVYDTYMRQQDESGQGEDWQFYLAVIDSVTGEIRITADLYDIRLAILADSLENILQYAWRTVNNIPMEEYLKARRSGRGQNNQYMELRTGLVVENLPFDDVLYELGRITGCEIWQAEIAVLVDACP
jgi:hypothetical protein